MGAEELYAIRLREADLILLVQTLRNQLIVRKIERNELMTKENMEILRIAESTYFKEISKELSDDYYYVKYSLLKDFKLHDTKREYDRIFARFSSDVYKESIQGFRKNVEDKKLFEKFKRGRLEERTINQDIDLSHLRIMKPSMFQTYK